jgi:hypothetical protein
MPLLQYFGWVGSFLLAALLAVNWCSSVPMEAAPRSDLPLNQKINIRIHTDHKWPERVEFDTTHSVLAQSSGSVTEAGPGSAARQPLDALAEMAPAPFKPCFRPPCPAARPRPTTMVGKPALLQPRMGIAMRGAAIFPSPPHRPPGRS